MLIKKDVLTKIIFLCIWIQIHTSIGCQVPGNNYPVLQGTEKQLHKQNTGQQSRVKPDQKSLKKHEVQSHHQHISTTKKIIKWPLERTVIRKELIDMLEDWGETAFEVDDILVRHVCYFFKYYSVKDYQRTNRAIKRSNQYLSYIIGVFKHYRLPEEIAFALPFVESSFNPKARSGAGAVGMFQFIKPTARQFGLTVRRNNDDRLDVYKAAPACAKYLRNNRNVFASSVLSLGSYHHGTGKVSQVLLSAANANERKFGPVFHNKRLGKYSKEYIPQCLSAALIYRFMKQMNIQYLPRMSFNSKVIRKTISAKAFEEKIPDLYTMNPDLTSKDKTYNYASTKGYVLLSNISMSKIDLIKAPLVILKQRSYVKEPIAPPIKKSTYKWPKNPSIKKRGIAVKGQAKYIRYVFQEGNELSVIAEIFGTSVYKIKKTRENKYLQKRSPRSGDVIRINGLSPTTQKIGGGGYVCGRQIALTTRNKESLNDICQRVKQTVNQYCGKKQWQLGTDISPELIYYWNKDVLENIAPNTQLNGDISLVVYTDYLWKKEKKSKTTQHLKTKDRSLLKRRKGKKFVTYIVQDKNIYEGKLIQRLSRIFYVSSRELILWNPKLKHIEKNPNAWIGKSHKIIIKNCPSSTQKFGNPGLICGKARVSDTRLSIKRNETIADVAKKARTIIQACGGAGKGVTEKNILFWNADILQKIDILTTNDRASGSAKLTVYVDFY